MADKDPIKLTKSPRIDGYKSPLLTSSFDQATGLPPQFDLSAPAAAATENGDDVDDFKGEPDRYQLFINEANSYSHVLTVAIALKGLEEIITANIVRHEDASHLESEACDVCDVQITKCKFSKQCSANVTPCSCCV
jgi:hypothetical protein